MRRLTRQKRLTFRCVRDAVGASICLTSFCAATWKQMFHLWCAVLKRHPGAVLWILAPQEDPSASHGSGGQQRLKEEVSWQLCIDALFANSRPSAQAAACGVAKHRVLFAPRVSRDAHISRLACADLFLDTCIYNGHTVSIVLCFAFPQLTQAPCWRFPSDCGRRPLGPHPCCGVHNADLSWSSRIFPVKRVLGRLAWGIILAPRL